MPPRRCETVMLVNDDPCFIDVVGDALRAEGLAVLLVPGIQQALAALRAGFTPDAVLLDLVPRAEVHDLLEALWSSPDRRRVPVIAKPRQRDHLIRISAEGRGDELDMPRDAEALARLLESVCATPARSSSEWTHAGPR